MRCAIELANAAHDLPWPAVSGLLIVLAIGKTAARIITACAAYRAAGHPRQDQAGQAPARTAVVWASDDTADETPRLVLEPTGSRRAVPAP